MEDRQEYRGFSISVVAQKDRAGGSKITLLMERPEKTKETPKPEHYHSVLTGDDAVADAMHRAKAAIDKALGPRNPFGD